MKCAKTLRTYPLILRLGKQILGLGLLASLAACQSAIRAPHLAAGDIFQLDSQPEGASGTSSIYARHFLCSNAKEVALSYIAVTAGEVKPIWEGNHKRVAGAKGDGCLLAMFKGSEEKPEALQIDFSFPDGQTAVSGTGQLMTLAELRQSDEQNVGSVRWDIPAGATISTTEPTLVRWQVILPQTMSVSDQPFESVSEIIDFSRDRPALIFQVVTLQLLS